MIPFNKPSVVGNEHNYIQDVLENGHLCGDGKYTKLCHQWLEENTGTKKALLTTSCTHALEMAALLINIQPGDEVIMPSYTFVSSANAFVLRGAKIVFVDVRPDTMNIDENKIERAITSRTRAIVPVHYAGVSCDMDKIMDISKKYQLYVIEDAAQGLMATYKGRKLGTIGHLGAYSFHETKNFISGEGGALLINDERFVERAEIIREKGTNRTQFYRGEVNKYTWQDIGSSYLPNELTAAFLFAQLEKNCIVHKRRLELWNLYYEKLKNLTCIELPVIPNGCKHNGHIFYIKVRDLQIRTDLINFLKKQNIQSVFHYIPLHSSPAGLKFGFFSGEDKYTTIESERLLRLPLFISLEEEEVNKVCEAILKFFSK